MKKFCVCGGFLGSGKTTLMIELTRYCSEHAVPTAMISNDLGGKGLADNRLACLSGCRASELTGTCICYQTENLVRRLDELYQEGCELVISDIPGFGIGALEHVYHKLTREYPGRFSLAPFTVLTEPWRVRQLREGNDPDLSYILEKQLEEADLILLNKCDLLSEQEEKEYASFLKSRFPDAQILCVSAGTGRGMDALCRILTGQNASLRQPDLGYGSSVFAGAMGRFSEFNTSFHAVVCCDDFDGNAYLQAAARGICEKIRAASGEIPHAKLLAWQPEGKYAKLDVLGVDRPEEFYRRFSEPCTELAVVVNASAMCPAERLEQSMSRALEEAGKQFRLTCSVYKTECFGAMGG